MHVGAALRLLLILLLDDSHTDPSARIQGDPLLPPCGTGVSHGRALGDPMHPGGASLGGLLVRAIPSQEIPREAGEALEGGTVGQGDPLARDPLKCLGSTPGMTVGQGDPIARGSRGSLGSTPSGGLLVMAIPSQEISRGAW